MFYTYCHTKKDTNKIFYIGKGVKNRVTSLKDRNQHWKNIVNKHGFNVQILAYWNTEEEALDHEKLLISCFKQMKYVLANKTDGGEGVSGFKHTDKIKNHLSKKMKGKPSHRKGKTISEEHKKKIGLANKGKKRSDKTIKKMSESAKLRKINK